MIEVIRYKPMHKDGVIGSFSLQISKWGNFCLHNLLLVEKNGKRYVTFPGMKYEKDGQQKFFEYYAFDSRENTINFKKHILEVIETFVRDYEITKQKEENQVESP